MTTTKPFTVNLWGSHPDLGNDDCHSGTDHDTLEEAKDVFSKARPAYYISHIELNGPGVHEVRENEAHDAKRRERESRASDAEWKREGAMQAGMALGVDGYNDEMGFDVDGYNDEGDD